jgi:hypothetical protein
MHGNITPNPTNMLKSYIFLDIIEYFVITYFLVLIKYSNSQLKTYNSLLSKR